MAKATKRNGDEPEADEPTPKTEGELPSQSVPYPTGGTYKPPLEYLAEETAPAPEAAKAKARAPSTEDDFDEPFRKGKK